MNTGYRGNNTGLKQSREYAKIFLLTNFGEPRQVHRPPPKLPQDNLPLTAILDVFTGSC